MGESRDPMDQPEREEYGLLYPFIVCVSNGGPYDDQPFVAGVQLGRMDAQLAAAEALGAREMRFTLLTDLGKQAELVGMARGFPIVEVENSGVEGWIYVTFRVEAAADGD